MPGTPKTDKKAMSDFQKIMMPMIRKILPNQLAQDILGVQCMTGPIGSIFNYRHRSNEDILFEKYPKLETNMIVRHTAIRPFMSKGNPEPNEYYRPWLEENVGEQGVDWNWQLSNTKLDVLEFYFSDVNDAILFELRWPINNVRV